MVLIAWWFAARIAGPWFAVAAVAPLALNPYTLGNAIWVMTDNLSLGLLAIAMGSSIFLNARTRVILATSLALVAAALVRQINVWVTAGAWLAVVLCLPAIGNRLRIRDPLQQSFSASGLVVISIGVAASFAVVGFFAYLWGGLVPPMLSDYHDHGLNVAVTPYTLTLLGVYGFPLWLLVFQRLRGSLLVRKGVLIGAVLGLALGILLESRTGIDVGRSGGWLWLAASSLPGVAGRSIVLVLGAAAGGALGGGLVASIIQAGRSRAALLGIVFAASFLAAYTVNSQAFQRYFDGPVLLALGWAMALAIRTGEDEHESDDRQQLLVAGVLAAAMQFVFSCWTIYRPLIAGEG